MYVKITWFSHSDFMSPHSCWISKKSFHMHPHLSMTFEAHFLHKLADRSYTCTYVCLMWTLAIQTLPCPESSGDSLLHFRWSACVGMSKNEASSSSSLAPRWWNVPLFLWAALFACFSTLVEYLVHFCGWRSVLCCFIVGLQSWGKISH